MLLQSQNSFILNKDVSEKIDFEFISNLIIIPIEINGVTLSFLLDSGVSKPILFNLSEQDSLTLKNAESFYLHGLGADGKLEAIRSKNNKFKIGNAVSANQDLYVVFDKAVDFTPRLGVLIHGIIGYDVFKGFVVEVNYNSKYIRLHNPNAFKPKTSKKWKTIPIKIYNRKPYLDAEITIDKEEKAVKLLIDTGSSDALWLFENSKKGLTPKKDLIFKDYLGRGLSGSVYGKRSKVKNFKVSDFNIEEANVAFPDSLSIDTSKMYKYRNGSLGGGILKRFNMFFDYTNEKLYLKKNSNYRVPFTYNNSGVVLEYNGVRYVKEQIRVPKSGKYSDAVQINFSIDYVVSLKPIYKIVEIRTSSNAFNVGLRKNDILIDVNGKPAYAYKLTEINAILHGKTGRLVKLRIERNGKNMFFKFRLDSAFKKNEPSN